MKERAVEFSPGSFGARVRQAVERSGPLCAGIDPSGELLRAWGLSDDVTGLRAFCQICVEAWGGGVVPVIKPQVAFFERHGSAGVAELERLIADAADADLIVLADAKRGDVMVTAAAYADAWLGTRSPLAADAVTVHPFLGLAALSPLVVLAGQTGRGVIVVVRSSNPEGRPLQEAVTASGVSVGESLLADIAALNASADIPSGTVGAVIGATLAATTFPLSQLGGVILAPGLGAQGARPSDVASRFGGCAPGSVLASTSRSLLSAGPDISQLRKSARELAHELSSLMG
jgi:orotidine-5'-phosphate decarboxylase